MRKPRIARCKFYHEISPELDRLARQLQEKLAISGNELCERAILALAKQQRVRRDHAAE
jgi:hypothetical protein